jgi:hypothetical protein
LSTLQVASTSSAVELNDKTRRIFMKDVIYLVVNANQVVRMTKTLPSLKRGEVPIKVSVSVDDNAFSTPTISREVIVTDWQKDVRLNDLELRQNFITEEEAEMIKSRRLERMQEILSNNGYTVVPNSVDDVN